MIPKEHGAWNALLVCLFAGWFCLGEWNGAALAAISIWLCVFVLRAPLNLARQYRLLDPPKARRPLWIPRS